MLNETQEVADGFASKTRHSNGLSGSYKEGFVICGLTRSNGSNGPTKLNGPNRLEPNGGFLIISWLNGPI